MRDSVRRVAGNVTLALAATVLAVLAGELVARVLHLAPPPEAPVQASAATAAAEQASPLAEPVVLHPFLAFAEQASSEPPPPPGAPVDIGRPNALGFRSDVHDYRQLGDGELVIGIFGGSVARGVTIVGKPALEARLRELLPPELGPGRIVNLATSAYKQPQQVIVLLEALLLGIPLDVVVEVDGFNEVALGGTDAERGHHPLYPNRGYWARVFGQASGALSAAEIEASADAIRLRRRARSLADRLAGGGPGRSHLLRALGERWVRKWDAEATAIEERLAEAKGEREAALARLADPCLGVADGCWDLITGLWAESSVLMARLAAGAGARYVHVLQPNQYVEGSKPLSDEERSRFFAPQRPWSRAARAGYPRLQARGDGLRKLGIRFHDLTGVFANHPETLYRDTCCHYNPRGFELLARAIAEAVAEALTAPPSPPGADA